MWDTGFPIQVKYHLNLKKVFETFLILSASCSGNNFRKNVGLLAIHHTISETML